MNQTLFETHLGKSYPAILFEEALVLFTPDETLLSSLHPKKYTFPNTCGECFGTGKISTARHGLIKCPRCNGSGQLKKCGCGSGIIIGTNEPFCIKCKAQPEPNTRIFISPNMNDMRYHELRGLYYFPPMRNP